MARKRTSKKADSSELTPGDPTEDTLEETESGDEEAAPDNDILCRLTQERHKRTEEEEALQDLIDQLHREYRFERQDMARDVKLSWKDWDEDAEKERSYSRKVALVVYQPGGDRQLASVRRLVVIVKKGTKVDDAKNGVRAAVDGVLLAAERAGADRKDLFAAWTNTDRLHFRHLAETSGGQLKPEDLADFPGVDETLSDFDTDRRPMRVASRASLYRAFRSVHDYLYGNQNMRGDRAFFQLLNLIFCKILDERESRRLFYVGATEANTEEGRKAIEGRIKRLFEDVKTGSYQDVFKESDEIELNDRALAYVAQELSRYSFLGSDTDAKGTAYETITATTMKRERGQFFTPRNVIRMIPEYASGRRPPAGPSPKA